MEILISTFEAEGFFKIGGIGDYVSGLSKVLSNEDNFNVKVIMPKFKSIDDENLEFLTSVHMENNSNYADELFNFNLYKSNLANVEFFFIDNEHYFSDEDAYVGESVYLRFAFFSKAIVETIKHLNWNIDVIHLNDKPDGLLPLICKANLSKVPKFILTIHSIYYAGHFKIKNEDIDLFNSYLGFKWKEKYVCFLKESIINSDKLVTVGISNAEDIQNPEKGFYLDKYIIENGGVTGILNGINYDIYPRFDDFDKFLKNKRKAKLTLQKKFNLEVGEDIPLFMFCGRLSGKQKGCHYLLGIMDYLMENNYQFILLGDGPRYRKEFRQCSNDYPNFIACIEHNEDLAQQLYEASDILLMPSLCEPNGLSQIIAMYYGTVPIVHNVGGLKDTVIDYSKYPDGNGFKFYNYELEDFLNAVNEALETFINKEKWTQVVKNCYNEDYSWDKMANPYIEIYNNLMEG